MNRFLTGVGDSAVTGSAPNLPSDMHRTRTLPGATRAPVRENSGAYRLPPAARYRARLAHHLYTVERKTLVEIAREIGVTAARVQQYVQLVEPGFDGHALRKLRAQGESA